MLAATPLHNTPGLNSGIKCAAAAAGDEDVPYVPHGEPERREQAEGGGETGGEAHRQGQRHRLRPAALRPR